MQISEELQSYILLSLAALLPVIFSVIFLVLEKKTGFGKINIWTRLAIIGVVFGGLAIVGTECGIPMNGAQVNCRDAAVLCAGLFFGGPAGIIAGLIGGIERWFAVYWGIGTYTRVACSVSTILAGFYASLLRRVILENKRPNWLMSLSIGIVMEIFHLAMVFVTNMSDVSRALTVVKACTLPMVIANGLSVMLASMAVAVTMHEKLSLKRENIRISETIQRWMLVSIIVAFFVSTGFTYALQENLQYTQNTSLLSQAIEDVTEDILDAAVRADGDMEEINQIVHDSTHNRRIGRTGYLIIADSYQYIVSAPNGAEDTSLYTHGLYIEPYQMAPNTMLDGEIDGESCSFMYATYNKYYIISVLPTAEATESKNIAIYVSDFMLILVFAALFMMIYMLIKTVVVNQMKQINKSLAEITAGDLDVVVDVHSNTEFAMLSQDINSTVSALKGYIAEAAARIDEELAFAKSIQASALPNHFPAFPHRTEFDIFAMMDTAKEVGGDFYDFYLTGKNMFNFLIADVSGKGIPAAMFMMKAKAELKGYTEMGLPINEAVARANDALCDGNENDMFVTGWQGGIDLETGHLQYVCAGHNPPLLYHDGKFSYFRCKPSLVLGAMDGVPYKLYEDKLEPGDIMFLYTDGVTEATNIFNELYGEDRLEACLNANIGHTPEEICQLVKEDVDRFVDEAPQFDDITMLCFKFTGKQE